MKRNVFTIIIFLLSVICKANQYYHLSVPLNGGQDHHYTASSYIELTDGFLADPHEGHSVVLEIDPYAVFPPEGGATGGAVINNTNGVVGSLGGVVDVSLLGGAVYDIPIDLPEGLGGMKPQLNICYNSQERNGMLGWGWNLGGTSSITRTGSTLYHDNQIGLGNRFCLDGKRLLMTSAGNYGTHGATYRTEQDEMSKVVSYQEAGYTGPSYFKVWTTNGNILHYGHSPDSKALVDQEHHVNIWLLNKVEDRDGNVMVFHYTTETDSYWLDEITYSGNPGDNIDPAFRVVFNYSDRSDIDITFVGNCVYRKKKLLNGISVFNGDAEMYSYTFTYQNPAPQQGYYHTRLAKVRLDAGEEHLNPTIIQWSNNNYSAISGPELKYNVTTNGISNAFVHAIKFSGDFNGDGFDDVLAVQPNSNGQYTQADVFVNKGLSGNLVFDHASTFNLSHDISWIQVADVNGDGFDDLLFSNRIRGIFPFPDHIETEFYLCHQLISGGFEFVRKYLPIFAVPSSLVETHLIGDFFGDGTNAILIPTGPESSILFQYDEATDDFLVHNISERLLSDRFFPADYNGDGITEILYQKENGTTAIVQLVKNNNSYHYQEIYNNTPSNWEDCFPGDYNGDGLIDILLYNGNHDWNIYLGQQDGLSNLNFALPQSFPYSSPGNYQFSLDHPHHSSQYIKVGDFDGNGCSDLALYKDNFFYVFYGPIRPDGTNAPFANTQKISTQAFNLYDNMGVCIGNFLGQERLSFLGPVTLSRLPSLPLRQEVRKVVDGLGRITEFEYDYLMPNPDRPSIDDFYHLNSPDASHNDHVHSSPIPLRALKKLTTYNVSNKPVVTQCYYEGALIHNQGKGLLGFSKTRQDDYCNGKLQKKTIRLFETSFSNNVIQMNMAEEEVYDPNGALMARSTYDYRTFTHVNNDNVYFSISNKSVEEFDVNHPERLLKKEIYETNVDTHCSLSNHYNDVISVICQTKGTTVHQNYTIASACEYQEIFSTSYLNNDLNNWLINRPSATTSVAHREGNYADICHHKTFTYYDNQPHRVKSILDIPNDGSHPEDPLVRKTDYQYDPVGNIIVQLASTPNDDQLPRIDLFEYSKDYGRRLLTKRTDALNQEYRYTYHPVYNYCSSATDCNGLTTVYEQDPLGVTSYVYHPDETVSCKVLRWNSNGYDQWEKQTGKETKWSFYAPSGDLTRTNSFDINGELLLTNIKYDHWGRVIKKSMPHKPNGFVNYVSYEYDPHNQVSHIYHSDGSYETIAHDGNKSTTRHFTKDGSYREESKTFNIMGWLVKSTDADGNSVTYDYRADGKPLWAQVEDHAETRITMDYDALGNQTLLSDPDYGSTSYVYNGFNEVTKQTTPKQDEIEFVYDVLGRIVQRTKSSKNANTKEVTRWTYGTLQGERGLITQISSTNQNIQYYYDPLLRLSEINERIMGTSYHTYYTYDPASRVEGVTYPSNYHVNYHYTSEGLLKCVTDEHQNNLWKTLETNTLLQPTLFLTGNGFLSEYTYDPNTNLLVDMMTRHNGKTVQNTTYDYDVFSNLTHRSDHRRNTNEQFGYDLLNRLISVDDNNGHSEFHYDALGRMTSKSSPEGTVFVNANYNGAKPHAIKTVQSPHGIFPQERLDLEFNVFDKVENITQGNIHHHFDYGYDHQRIRMVENDNGIVRTKTYVNNCDFITQENGDIVTRTFIAGPIGVFAVAETVKGVTKLHYIHKDHLGNWSVISDSEGNIEQENHFDAWGVCSNADNLMFDRGFTGHEHIRGTGLINMNGRLYDPLTSCMLSPDNNIQMPDFSQNLNRYAYCLNNPLTFTDPDGNTALEAALIFYLVYCTDFGYEFQKYTQALAAHIDLHLSSQQIGIGFDFSLGIPKKYGISYRTHLGMTYYWRFYDGSYSGFEFRLGGEWCLANGIGYSGTTFYQGKSKQTTNSIILGTYWCNFTYENDYMFNIGKYIPLVPAADNGDRYRTAAARFRLTAISLGVNLFTGDPGVDHNDRRTFNDPDASGRETYTISANGDNPDRYRAGVFYVGIGPFKVGGNSEGIRNLFQNRFAHDFLSKKDSPYFKVLNRPGHVYFYFGTETGSTLW